MEDAQPKKFDWSPNLLRTLTYGCTVELDGERVRVLARLFRSVDIDGVVDPVAVEKLDPATIEPPSIEFIRELAQKKVGAFPDLVGEERDAYGVPCVVIATDQFLIKVFDTAKLDRRRGAVAAILWLKDGL